MGALVEWLDQDIAKLSAKDSIADEFVLESESENLIEGRVRYRYRKPWLLYCRQRKQLTVFIEVCMSFLDMKSTRKAVKHIL